MNFLGKMLTIMIFAMSLVFMTFSVMVFATHTKWKDAVLNPNTGLKVQLEREKSATSLLKAEIEKRKLDFAAEQAARAYAIGALQAKLTQLTEQLQQKEGELRIMQGEHTQQIAAFTTLTENEKKLQSEVELLREQITKTREESDLHFDKVVSLTDDLNAAKDIERILGERNDSLVSQMADQKRVMDRVGLTPYSDVEKIPPQVDGEILAVGEKDFVEISLGSDDGLKKGHEMEAYRGTNYLGRVIIVKTEPNRAIAMILREYRKGNFRKGDRVTTRLS